MVYNVKIKRYLIFSAEVPKMLKQVNFDSDSDIKLKLNLFAYTID